MWRPRFPLQVLEDFERRDHFHIQRRNRKGRLKKIDLKAMVMSIRRTRSDTLDVTLRQQMDALVRPQDLLRHLFKMAPDVSKHARVIKLRTHHRPRRVPSTHPGAGGAENRG